MVVLCEHLCYVIQVSHVVLFPPECVSQISLQRIELIGKMKKGTRDASRPACVGILAQYRLILCSF